MKIVIIGAGIFGMTTFLKLVSKRYDCILLEKEKKIMYNLNQVKTFDNLINIALKNINKKKQNDFQLFEKYFQIYQKIKSFITTVSKNFPKN